MKLLLLTDIPPTTQLTAGLVLDRLVQFMPRGAVCCFAAINPAINLYASVDWMPCEFYDKPIELGTAATGKLDRLCSWVEEEWRQRSVGRKLLKKAIAFGRAQQVTAVFACLQGQTMIRIALPLARALRVPLYTLVWDPPEWWIAGHNINGRSAKRMLRRFDEAIRASRACAVASWAMAEEYQKRYGTFSIPVIASHDRANAKFPPPKLHFPDRLIIGMAGQFYAMEEWNKLISTLQLCGWKIAGRDVYLKILGHWLPPAGIPPERVEFLGWKPQPEAIEILSTADLLYCPYPFSDTLKDVSRFSFPSKVVLYLAAGRPAVFHGPAFASPARYLDQRNAAFMVTANWESAIYNALYRAVQDPVAYATVAENGRQAFLEDFTLERMRENFYAFLGTNEHELAATAPRHSGLAMQRVYRARAWELPPRPTLKALVDARLAKLARLVDIVRRPLKAIGRRPADPISPTPVQTPQTGARLHMIPDEAGWSWVASQGQAAEEHRVAIGMMSDAGSGAIAGIAMRTDASTRLLVTRSGEIGIGTLTPQYTLHVNGSISGASYSQVADARLAEHVTPISGAVELVQHLQGVRFLWRFPEDREIGRELILQCDEPQMGFVAQQIETVLPEAVGGGDTGIKTVQVPSVVPVLVEAIKEQQGQLDDLHRQIAMLEARLAGLMFVAGK